MFSSNSFHLSLYLSKPILIPILAKYFSPLCLFFPLGFSLITLQSVCISSSLPTYLLVTIRSIPIVWLYCYLCATASQVSGGMYSGSRSLRRSSLQKKKADKQNKTHFCANPGRFPALSKIIYDNAQAVVLNC